MHLAADGRENPTVHVVPRRPCERDPAEPGAPAAESPRALGAAVAEERDGLAEGRPAQSQTSQIAGRRRQRVAAAVQSAKGRGASKVQAWDAAWRDVYALADAVCARAMAGTLGEALDAKL